MVEFLIYNKDNWMDVPSKQRPDLIGKENVERKITENLQLSLEQRITESHSVDFKYKARDRRGDIIEVRKIDAPSGRKEPLSFAFIIVPLEFEKAKRLYQQKDRDEKGELIHNRKYWIDMTGVVLDAKKEATLTVADFENRIRIKK